MLMTIPPNEPAKRKEFFIAKMERATVQLGDLMNRRDNALDALFAEFDQVCQFVSVGSSGCGGFGAASADAELTPCSIHLTERGQPAANTAGSDDSAAAVQ